MNELISQFFGDPYIKLSCGLAGECMHYTQAPDWHAPKSELTFSPVVKIVILSGAIGILLIAAFGIFWFKRRNESGADGYSLVATSDQAFIERHASLMNNHVPCTLMFRNLAYLIDSTKGSHVHQAQSNLASPVLASPPTTTSNRGRMSVLDNVQGIVRPGQVMAIMGGSGAGKTTFLDILARKNKAGAISGDILVNGKYMDNTEFRDIIGYVDQEDTLMDTLTVYETILYSALLRLPQSMSYETKKQRVQDTMIELDILHIANRRIGSAGKRGLSGGEKRRVSIACELVTSPSILFLDEPTSGLDTYNAYNVIESLVSLAREFQRTVIFTIHQPRSNIYALFDELVLLSKGRVVYSGPAQQQVIDHFYALGYECPLGFNIADYLVDLTMHAAKDTLPTDTNDSDSEDERPGETVLTESQLSMTSNASGKARLNIRAEQEGKLYSPKSPSSSGVNSIPLPLNQRVSQQEQGPSRSSSFNLLGSYTNSNLPIFSAPLSDELKRLIEGYERSSTSAHIRQEISQALSTHYPRQEDESAQERFSVIGGVNRENVTEWTRSFLSYFRSSSKASWMTQFTILSGRTFKNLIRNPDLLLTHYLISVLVALISGILFKLDDSLAGFQNRLGVMFFICALFGFGCLSSMQIFASERLIFVRERANRYYSPITYFVSKIFCDIIPLRVVPPLILGMICYVMININRDPIVLLRFLLVLVLFNMTAASACFAIAVIFKDLGVANLIATLIMLFEMLFGGLLLNKSTIPEMCQWLYNLSFFNYAFEALVVNEVATLVLKEEKYGLKIDVPGALILKTFGLNAQGYWADVNSLLITCSIFLGVAFIWLQFMVKEKR